METISHKNIKGNNWKDKLRNYCNSQLDINLWYSDDNNIYGIETKSSYSARTVINILGYVIGALKFNLNIDLYDAYLNSNNLIIKFKITEEE